MRCPEVGSVAGQEVYCFIVVEGDQALSRRVSGKTRRYVVQGSK